MPCSARCCCSGCRPGFFLPVRVLSRLFRRRFLEELQRLHDGGKLRFFGEHAALADAAAFKAWLAPLRKCEWVVYAKRPFAGPQAVLAYLRAAWIGQWKSSSRWWRAPITSTNSGERISKRRM